MHNAFDLAAIKFSVDSQIFSGVILVQRRLGWLRLLHAILRLIQ